jgi:hypothetical protein
MLFRIQQRPTRTTFVATFDGSFDSSSEFFRRRFEKDVRTMMQRKKIVK